MSYLVMSFLVKSVALVASLKLVISVPDILVIPGAIEVSILASLVEQTSKAILPNHVGVDTHACPSIHSCLSFLIRIKLTSRSHKV